MPAPARLSDYARRPVIKKAVADAQASGIAVGAIELAPGGIIRIVAIGGVPHDEFERLEREGALD